MQPGRSESVTALVVASAALLLTCVFGFLSFTPGVDAGVAEFLQLAFFGGAIVTLGAFVVYFVMSRRSPSGQPPSKFERLLQHRQAALGAVPVGLVAVLIGVMWYFARRIGEWSGGPGIAPPNPATQTVAAFDTAGIAAFLIFGSIYVIVSVILAIRTERAAIHVAREEAEVNLS